jgi:DNA-binding IclR family transcriptional regulator
VIAAVSISGPSYRFNLDKQKSMIKAVMETGDKISSKLGFKNTAIKGEM